MSAARGFRPLFLLLKACGRPVMIWATTTYFNPQRYATRLRNFREFRRRLTVPLVAVELAFGRPFELVPGDADILIQLRAGHVMWQKERLLNLALAAVPPDCDYIAWLDGDVVFEDDGWSEKACSALQKAPLIQLFDRLCHLPRHASANSWHEESGPTLTSLVAGLKDGSIPDAAFVRSGASQRWSYTPGHAWAARRDLLEEHGFYDGLILGAGDKAIVNAAFGELAAFASSYWMNERQAEHYLKWGEGFAQSVERNVGCLGGLLYHLWHGELQHRNYWGRYRDLVPHQFDPFADIEVGENRCWRWSSDKPEMHRLVADYFVSRKEDG